MDATIPCMVETQMHTAGLICLSRIANNIYVMVMREFGPVFYTSASIIKGMVKLILHNLNID